MSHLTVISACDGIGCAHEALNRAGLLINKYYSFEVDKYAIAVNQHNHPATIQLGDLTKWEEHIKTIGEPNLIIGSTPCQNLSIAGNRQGLKGAESRLFWDFYKMVDYWHDKPFVFENVASMKKETRDYISSLLGVEPIMINAALVSAQQRKRYFWTNIQGILPPMDKHIFLKDILESGESDKLKSYCLTATYSAACPTDLLKGKRTQIFNKPERVGGFDKCGQGNRIYSIRGKSVTLSSNGGGRGAKTGMYKIDLPDSDYIIRKLTTIECERLMTLPRDYTALGNFDGVIKPISNTQRYKMCGNGIVVDVLTHIFKRLGAVL